MAILLFRKTRRAQCGSNRTSRSLKRYAVKERAMPKKEEGHGIILDEKSREQPPDTPKATKTEPGHMPSQPKNRSQDNRMTSAQETYLKNLCAAANEPAPNSKMTDVEATEIIDRLRGFYRVIKRTTAKPQLPR
jgi:hypothetical protein